MTSIHSVSHLFARAKKINLFVRRETSKREEIWVWQYTKRVENKAYCNLCEENDNEFSYLGDCTGSLGRRLFTIRNEER